MRTESHLDPGPDQRTEDHAGSNSPYPPYRPPLASRVARGALILLSVVVAAGFVLILLPQGALDRMARTLQASKAAEQPSERIALLYLGDEITGREFHVRGIVRNISPDALEKVDVTIRLYSPEKYLLETVVVRTDSETISPDATAEFHLVYADYKGQFSSYSADFKLRTGEILPYKDRRGARQHK